MYKKRILIGVCTCQKPTKLINTLQSINRMELPENYDIEILIADNCINKSAYNVYSEFRKESLLPIAYINEIKKGDAAVKNKILKEALKKNVDYVAFTNDNAYVDKEWIIELIQALCEFNADAVTGPVVCQFEKKVPIIIRNFFKSNMRIKTGTLRKTAKTDNVLFNMKIVRENNLYFKEDKKNICEDTDFFSKAAKDYNIVWSHEAFIYKTVPKYKTSIKWLVKQYLNLKGA